MLIFITVTCVCVLFIRFFIRYNKRVGALFLFSRKMEKELSEKIRQAEVHYKELEVCCHEKEERIGKLTMDESLFHFFQKQIVSYQAQVEILIERYQDEFGSTPFYKDFVKLKRQFHIGQYQDVSHILEKCEAKWLEKLRDKVPSLTKEEILLILLLNYSCPEENICAVFDVTGMTLNKRKFRLKQKILESDRCQISTTGTLKMVIAELIGGLSTLENRKADVI